MIALPNIYLAHERYIVKQFKCFKKIKEKTKKMRQKHKYDDLEEVIIPKNVDFDEAAAATEIVNP